jgi:hypothetical protein
MGHNVEVVMQEPSNVNLVIQMWLMIQSSPFLVLKLSEYIKVVEITMMQVLGLIEDEKTFNNLFFKKSKLHKGLNTHFDLCVRMFTQNFNNANNFLYDAVITTWKEVYIRYYVDC